MTGSSDPASTPPLWKRLLWMVALWAASVAVLGAIGLAIRLALSP